MNKYVSKKVKILKAGAYHVTLASGQVVKEFFAVDQEVTIDEGLAKYMIEKKTAVEAVQVKEVKPPVENKQVEPPVENKQDESEDQHKGKRRR